MTSISSNGHASNLADHPLGKLSRDDLTLITEFVLRSGSLKSLAKHYGVSYPTIRGRLDQVIERLEAAVAGRERDPLAELLADMVERGELAGGRAREILGVARMAKEHGRQNGRVDEGRGLKGALDDG